MPIGLRGRPDVFDFVGPAPYFAMASKFTRNVARSRPGGEVYAHSEIVGHISFLMDFFGPFRCMDPGMAGLCTRLKTKGEIAEKYRQALEERTGGR